MSIFYKDNELEIKIRDWDSTLLLVWDKKQHALFRETGIVPNASFVTEYTVANWPNLKAWLRRAYKKEILIVSDPPSELAEKPGKPDVLAIELMVISGLFEIAALAGGELCLETFEQIVEGQRCILGSFDRAWLA